MRIHSASVGDKTPKDPIYNDQGYPHCPSCGTLLLNFGYNVHTKQCTICGQKISNYTERLDRNV